MLEMNKKDVDAILTEEDKKVIKVEEVKIDPKIKKILKEHKRKEEEKAKIEPLSDIDVKLRLQRREKRRQKKLSKDHRKEGKGTRRGKRNQDNEHRFLLMKKLLDDVQCPRCKETKQVIYFEQLNRVLNKSFKYMLCPKCVGEEKNRIDKIKPENEAQAEQKLGFLNMFDYMLDKVKIALDTGKVKNIEEVEEVV